MLTNGQIPGIDRAMGRTEAVISQEAGDRVRSGRWDGCASRAAPEDRGAALNGSGQGQGGDEFLAAPRGVGRGGAVEVMAEYRAAGPLTPALGPLFAAQALKGRGRRFLPA
jgi:hypothetical protein